MSIHGSQSSEHRDEGTRLGAEFLSSAAGEVTEGTLHSGKWKSPMSFLPHRGAPGRGTPPHSCSALLFPQMRALRKVRRAWNQLTRVKSWKTLEVQTGNRSQEDFQIVDKNQNLLNLLLYGKWSWPPPDNDFGASLGVLRWLHTGPGVLVPGPTSSFQ